MAFQAELSSRARGPAEPCLNKVAPQEHNEPMECFDRLKRYYAALVATERVCRTELETST
jgi:hypothetical protein